MARSSGDLLAECCQCSCHTRQAELSCGGLSDPIAFSHCWQQFFSQFKKINKSHDLDIFVYKGVEVAIFKDESPPYRLMLTVDGDVKIKECLLNCPSEFVDVVTRNLSVISAYNEYKSRKYQPV